MPRLDLRAQGEADLASRLLRDVEIRQLIERIEKEHPEEGARLQLLGRAMRLTAEMAPDVHETVAACGRALDLAAPVETFVYPSPYFNAAAVRPERGRYLMAISSSLLEAFEPDELRFVVGHELGHFLFEHHAIPVAALVAGPWAVRPALALQLFAWQRFAEVSADRAGLLSAGSLQPAARGLFKLASGLRGDRVRPRIDQFLAQVSELQQEADRPVRADDAMRPDWLASHPFNPLRLRAAEIFSRSALMTTGGLPASELEAGVQDLMAVMEPSYLKERTSVAEAMRRLLFAGGVAVAAASGKVDEKAIQKLEELLGPGSLPFELKPDVIKADLRSRLEDARQNVPALRRAQVIRDLCLIAKADGKVQPEERKVLRDIAAQVEVDLDLVSSTLEGKAGCNGTDRAAAPSRQHAR